MSAVDFPEFHVIWSQQLPETDSEAAMQQDSSNPNNATPRPIAERGVCIFAPENSDAEEVKRHV